MALTRVGPGLTYQLFVGKGLPKDMRRLCSVRSPSRFVFMVPDADSTNMGTWPRSLRRGGKSGRSPAESPPAEHWRLRVCRPILTLRVPPQSSSRALRIDCWSPHSTRGLIAIQRCEPLDRGLEIKDCPFVNLPEAKSGRWGAGLTAAKMKDCRWLKPVLVAQIDFLEWTGENHLRHTTFIALRDDKRARDVRRE